MSTNEKGTANGDDIVGLSGWEFLDPTVNQGECNPCFRRQSVRSSALDDFRGLEIRTQEADLSEFLPLVQCSGLHDFPLKLAKPIGRRIPW